MGKTLTTSLAIGSLALGSAFAQDVREEQFEGTVISVDTVENTLQIRDDDGGDIRTLTIDENSEIYFEGRRAGLVEGALDDVRPGDEVNVELEFTGDTERVRRFSRDRNATADADVGVDADLEANVDDGLDADEPETTEVLAQNNAQSERRLPSTATPSWIYGSLVGLLMLAAAAAVRVSRVRRATTRR